MIASFGRRVGEPEAPETALWDIGRRLSCADCEYFWVQDWVQLAKEEWLRVLCKRHQTRHLDFCPARLLTEVSNLARGAILPLWFQRVT